MIDEKEVREILRTIGELTAKLLAMLPDASAPPGTLPWPATEPCPGTVPDADGKIIYLPFATKPQETPGFLKLTPKELSKMPKKFKEIYRLKGGKVAYIRQRQNGTYEIRYRRDGLSISVGSKDLDEAKDRFIAAICEAEPGQRTDKVPFGQFATQWLEIVKKPRIKETTYEDYVLALKTHVFPRFAKRMVKEIKPLDVQVLLNSIEQKTPRAAGKVYVLLNAIFNFAIAEDLISRNPMALIGKPRHEARHGEALLIEEEREFVKKCLDGSSPCGYAYILMLYTGIRRAELASVKIEPQWISVVTAKTRKGQGARIRKIPISPMLKPFVGMMTRDRLKFSSDKLSRDFPLLAPGHHLHELRHTFITRCQECGVSRELTSLWAGHRADNTVTSNVYTHFSEVFQLSEVEKLRY